MARAILPRRPRAGISDGARALTRWPPVGFVDWGDLRRLEPISLDWGSDLGTVIDRYYIEHFLAEHASSIRGAVLEVKNRDYTERFGSGVTASDVLDISTANPIANVVADLTAAPQLPNANYDCVILTQTLQFVFEKEAALDTVQRILRPNGTLLTTVPGLCPISLVEMVDYGEYWRFTKLSLRRLLESRFHRVDVVTFGNVLAAAGMIYGIAAEELTEAELLPRDPRFEMVIAARAFGPRATDEG